MRKFSIPCSELIHFTVCGQLICKNQFLHMKRIFDENVLIIVNEGTLYINSNNKNYAISKNQYLVLKSQETHFGYKETDGYLDYYWVHFSNEMQIDNTNSCSNDFYTFNETGTVENSTRLNLLFKQLMNYFLEKENYNPKILDYSLSVFMMEFCRNFNESKKTKSQNPVINDVCNWIKLNFQSDFSLEELSKEVKLEQSYLSKLFKKNTGKTIVQYTTDIRISVAKNLLPNFSVKETAYSCGFEDEKYFMKVFKKSEGITPTQFKQAFSLRNVNQ